MSEIASLLDRLRVAQLVRGDPPVDEAARAAFAAAVGPVPEELLDFYRNSNGAQFTLIRILPIEDPSRVKATWDGVSRANDPARSRFVQDQEFLQRFLVFAQLSGMNFAAIERATGRIWCSYDGDLHETTLSLAEFIDGAAHEKP